MCVILTNVKVWSKIYTYSTIIFIIHISQIITICEIFLWKFSFFCISAPVYFMPKTMLLQDSVVLQTYSRRACTSGCPPPFTQSSNTLTTNFHLYLLLFYLYIFYSFHALFSDSPRYQIQWKNHNLPDTAPLLPLLVSLFCGLSISFCPVAVP